MNNHVVYKILKTRHFYGCQKFFPQLHIRKFSHKVKKANVVPTTLHEYPFPNVHQNAPNSHLPVIFLNTHSKYIDLGKSSQEKSNIPFNDAQKLKNYLLHQSNRINFSSEIEINDVIESKLDYIHDGEKKVVISPKLVSAVQPTGLEWREQVLDKSTLFSHYLKLSKIRLTGLVVLTAIAGYAMAPAPIELVGLSCIILGTGLTSGAANTINQFLEVPFDSQMSRTKNRVLVKGYISPLHAIIFAGVSCSTGLGLLYFGANALTAGLGALNLLLYTSVYTPMKRYSTINTWVGSIVGAIPPMMGWAACTGSLDLGAWVMAGMLFAWQFPHFNALSWNLRPDYSRAGYRMMSVINPSLCKKTALKYSVGIGALSILAPVLDVTTWTFAIDSLPLNAFLIVRSWQFYQNGDSNSSRKLFLLSLVHLPALMILMLISKKHYTKSENSKSDFSLLAQKVNQMIPQFS